MVAVCLWHPLGQGVFHSVPALPLALVVLPSPMLPAEHATEPGAERIALGLIWVSRIDWRTIWGGQFCGLSIGQRAMDCCGRDAVDLVAVHETDAVGSRDHDAVEQVQIGYLQNMLDRSELFAAAGQQWRMDSKGCVRDRFFSAHPLRLRPRTSQHRRNQFTARMPPARPRVIMKNGTACGPVHSSHLRCPTELHVGIAGRSPPSPSWTPAETLTSTTARAAVSTGRRSRGGPML